MQAWLAYVVVMFIGVLLMWLSHWDLPHLLSSFGHALVIAAVLGLTVDGLAKRHILAEVSRDIYQFLIGHGLPDQLQRKIRDVMQISLVRHDCLLRYRLESLGTNLVRAHIAEEFTVRNYGGTPQSYRTHVGDEDYVNLVVHSIECHGASVEPYSLKSPGLRRNPEKPGTVWAYGNSITIPPGESDVHVVWRYSIDVTADYSNIHAWVLPTIGVRVEAEPSHLFSFSVTGADENIGQTTWILRKAFMPGEAVKVRWFRK